MRILIVSQYYPPEPAHYPSTLATHLAAQGHEVRVLTGFPNYPQGSLYQGYSQRWSGREVDGAVEILRKPLFLDHSQRALHRAANYISFGLSSAAARRFATGADIVYVYATQMTAATGPWLWRLLGGAPYVLHVQDLWPDSITGSTIAGGKWARRTIESLIAPWMASIYRNASGVIGIAPTMIETLRSRGVQSERLHLVYNWAIESPRPAEATRARSSSTRVLYAGNVGDMQDLGTAVMAAHFAADAGITLRIIGDGVALPALQALADELRMTNIEFFGRVDNVDMGQFYASADFSLVTLKDLPAFRGTIPSKVQTSLANGLPLITNVQGDVAWLVKDRGLGLLAHPEDPRSLENAFREAAALKSPDRLSMADNARRAHDELFSRETGLRAVERILINCGRA